jgi:hypothetical protein
MRRRGRSDNSDSVANLADFPEGPSIGPEHAMSRQSVPHRYTLTFVSKIPSGMTVLRDFKFSSLLNAQSGRSYNVFAGSDANGDGNPLSDRPGILGRNTIEGPGFATFDMRVAREVRFNERVNAEFSFDSQSALSDCSRKLMRGHQRNVLKSSHSEINPASS